MSGAFGAWGRLHLLAFPVTGRACEISLWGFGGLGGGLLLWLCGGWWFRGFSLGARFRVFLRRVWGLSWSFCFSFSWLFSFFDAAVAAVLVAAAAPETGLISSSDTTSSSDSCNFLLFEEEEGVSVSMGCCRALLVVFGHHRLGKTLGFFAFPSDRRPTALRCCCRLAVLWLELCGAGCNCGFGWGLDVPGGWLVDFMGQSLAMCPCFWQCQQCGLLPSTIIVMSPVALSNLSMAGILSNLTFSSNIL